MDLVSAARQNAQMYGNERTFTFVSEAPGRTYQEQSLGFGELDRRARGLAGRLQAMGMRDRTALLLYPEGLDFVTAFAACLYAGVVAIPAPLPELDAGRAVRTLRIIGDADVTLILTDGAHLEQLGTWLRANDLAGRLDCLATDAAVLDADPADWSPPPLRPDTLAFLQYTSGSTGDPKGVMVTHGNLLHNAEEIRRCVRGSAGTIGVGWIPHYHDMGLVGQLVAPLYFGCRYVFTSPITFLKRPVMWLEMISRHRATNTVAPNFGYDLVLRRVTDEAMAGLDLSSLRIAQNGAEPVRADTLARMVERFGQIGFKPEVWGPCYGMAETTLLVTGARAGDGPVVREFDSMALARNLAVDTADEAGRRLVSSGRPIGMDVRIVEPDLLVEQPDGVIGEIWVRGGSVARGYWRRPAATRETFGAFTAAGRGPFLRTGDLGFRLDGELYVTGRRKDLIIVNGVNIYAHDLEEAARAAHPAARTAAAFAVDDGRERVVVVQEISVAATRGTPLAELASHIGDTVRRAFGVPALSVVLAERGAVRRTTSGKVQRQLTRADYLDGRIRSLDRPAGRPADRPLADQSLEAART